MTNNNKDIPHHVKKKEKPCFRNSIDLEGRRGGRKQRKETPKEQQLKKKWHDGKG